MRKVRLDHIGVVVDDLDAAAAFFLSLGFEREGAAQVEGDVVDRINGLHGVRAEMVWIRTPDGTGKLELIKYHAPADTDAAHPSPPNRAGFRHICVEVDNLHALVDGLRGKGFDTVGEVQDFVEHGYRLCFFRGPEGLILELVERLSSEGAK